MDIFKLLSWLHKHKDKIIAFNHTNVVLVLMLGAFSYYIGVFTILNFWLIVMAFASLFIAYYQFSEE